MRAVVQRVCRAEVRVRGGRSARIGHGLLVLIGFEAGDGEPSVRWAADKISDMRIFPDGEGRMNLSVVEAGGRCLAVSQFTLLGDARKGRRPSFVRAMDPAQARPLYDLFVKFLSERTGPVETGEFGASMEVDLVNDGPVTILLERSPAAG